MKKILAALLTVACVQAAPYAGLKAGFSVLKMNPKLKGEEYGNSQTFGLGKMNLTAFDLGIIAGYQHKMSDKIALLAEVDYEMSFKTTKKEDLNSSASDADFAGDTLSLRKKHAFGVMPAVRYNINDKFYSLVGLRLGLTQYEAKANDVDPTDGASDKVTGRKFVMSVEPTVGAGFDVSDNLSARMTVGYVVGQKKKIINNYATPGQIRVGLNKSIHVKPRGWNVRFALIRAF